MLLMVVVVVAMLLLMMMPSCDGCARYGLFHWCHVGRGKLQNSRVNFNNAKPVVVDVKTRELSYEARWIEDQPYPYPDIIHEASATGEIRLLVAYAVRTDI
jgi:hypothetical protein